MKPSILALTISTLAAAVSVHGAPVAQPDGNAPRPPLRTKTTLDWIYCGPDPLNPDLEQWTCTDSPEDCHSVIDSGSTRLFTCLAGDKAGQYYLDHGMTMVKRTGYGRPDPQRKRRCVPIPGDKMIMRCGR